MLHNVDHLPLVQRFRSELPGIRADLKMLQETEGAIIKPRTPTIFNENLYEGSMDMCLLKIERFLLDPHEQKIFDRDPEGTQARIERRMLLTTTCLKLVREFPEIRQFYFHVLHPKGKIGAHYGVHGKKAVHQRIQFTLDPGEDCWFFCNEEKLKYSPDLVFSFDDGHDLHWVENHGDKPRTVLIIDAWK